MKKIVSILMTSLIATLLQAQTIHLDHKFWDGENLYTVKEIRMGTIFYMTTSQGDELTLEKVKEGEYKIIPSREADDCPFGAEFGWRVQHIRQEGESFLAVRKPNGDIMWTMEQTTNNEDECRELQMMMGQEEPWNAVNGVLLNRAYLQNYVATKKELRILRNKILAYHGYRFQSEDLQEYFSNVRWYKPGNNNDAIKLSIVEQMNIQLIKSEEASRPEDPKEEVLEGTSVEMIEEDIVGRIRELYDVIAQKKEDINRFACHTWWDTIAAVDRKDADVEEIGFFNDDLWTQMQDDNPDAFEVRDIKFLELDLNKGTALVDFVLWSSIQTVHQKFEFCREEGDWRVHNIIRYYTDSDGKEAEDDLLEAMIKYLAEPQEESSELVFLPDLTNDKPLDLSDGNNDHKKYIPYWDENNIIDEDGTLVYDLNLGYDLPLQQWHLALPGKPLDMKEVSRVILKDVNHDGYSDALVCLGRYGSDNAYYFDIYVWDPEEFGGLFKYVGGSRSIPNPRIDEEFSGIIGRNGYDREMWSWQGMNQLVQSAVEKDYYK
ncbi:MAG: YARHG domain-containing protein [Bacteroidaceae bacterium]|nr:YARHG domain-containing protein [Bacteroidaceae bacterium]